MLPRRITRTQGESWVSSSPCSAHPQKVKFTGKALATGTPVLSHPQAPPGESRRPLAGMQTPRKDRQNKPVGRSFREEAHWGQAPRGEPQQAGRGFPVIRADTLSTSLASRTEERDARSGTVPTGPKGASCPGRNPDFNWAPPCAPVTRVCQPLPWAWGGSLSPRDELSDLRDAPSHSSPFEFAKEKRKTKITRLASSGQKPDTSGLSLSENRCGAESLIKVMDGVWTLGTSPHSSMARAQTTPRLR